MVRTLYLLNSGILSLTSSSFCSTWLQAPEVIFSDSGTYVVMAFDRNFMPSVPHVIDQIDADPLTTRYFPLDYPQDPRKHLTPSGDFVIEIEEVDRTSARLVSRKLAKSDLFDESANSTRPDPDEYSVYLDNFICYPSSLAESDRYLLLGQNHDEMMRLLIAPREGRALEIRSLSVTFNEAKRRLESEWAKREALENEEMEGTWKQNEAIEGSEERGEVGGLASDPV